MRYVDEFRDRRLVEKLARDIRAEADTERTYNIMEVCGTHTMSIFKFGLRAMLPGNIRLVSGPGCPVCVTPNDFLDKAVWLARQKDTIVVTFGDMLKVPSSHSSLEREKACGADIKIVYSTSDAIRLAGVNPDKEVIFLGVGFETTIPTVAASILTAKRDGLKNYTVLCGHKTMPQALRAIAADPAINVDGFLLPGHVSAIIGVRPYEFLAARYRRKCVIAGFEPSDIMQAILMLIKQRKPKVEIQYTRVMRRPGNRIAEAIIQKVFRPSDSIWRGIGCIKKSGLSIRREFSSLDAETRFSIRTKGPVENRTCICSDVLKGVRTPPDCKLFGTSCSPSHPVGACMVSSEGACAAYYRYGRK